MTADTTCDGITVKRIHADLDGALTTDGILLIDRHGAMNLGFERESADYIAEVCTENAKDWDGEVIRYDAEADSYVLSKEGEVLEVDEGQDWCGMHLYFIGCQLGYVWGWAPEDGVHLG